MARPSNSAPAFSRSGVSVAEVDALEGSFVNAHRWLLLDGSTRFVVELIDRAFTTPSTPPTEGAIEIVACGGDDRGGTRIPGEIVARACDGRLSRGQSVARGAEPLKDGGCRVPYRRTCACAPRRMYHDV